MRSRTARQIALGHMGGAAAHRIGLPLRQLAPMGGSTILAATVAMPSHLPTDAEEMPALQDPATGAFYWMADYSVIGGGDVLP